MQEPHSPKNEMDSQDIENLLTRLRESINIYERKPNPQEAQELSPTAEAVTDAEKPQPDDVIDDSSVADEEENTIPEEEVAPEEDDIPEEAVAPEEDDIPEEADVSPKEELPEVKAADTASVLPEDTAFSDEYIDENGTLAFDEPTPVYEEAIEAESHQITDGASCEEENESYEFEALIDDIDLDELVGLVDVTVPQKKIREYRRYKAAFRRQAPVSVPVSDEVTTENTQSLTGALGDEVSAAFSSVKKIDLVQKPSSASRQEALEETVSLPADETLSGAAAASVDYSAFHIADPHSSAKERGQVEEFVSKDQVGQINRDYHREKKSLLWRLVVSGVLTGILLLAEVFMFFGLSIEGVLGIADYPFILPLCAMQLQFICIALTTKQIKEGTQALGERKSVPETYYLTAEVWIALYGIFACVQPGLLHRELTFTPLLAVLGCLLSFFVLLSDYLRLDGQYASFHTISLPGDKLAAEIARVSVRPEEYKLLRNTGASRALHVKKVEFVDGFFRQMNRRIEDFSLNLWILIFVNAAALILFFTQGFFIHTFSPALGAMLAATVLFVATPFSFYFAHRYPVYRASLIAAEENCAFVGESAVQMYSLADVMVFEDVEAFTSANTRICRIKLPSGVQVHQVLFYLTKAFGVIGGPLFGLFSTATEGVDDYSDTELISTVPNGLFVRVGNKRVHIGNAAYLVQNGIAPYYDEEDDKYKAEGKISLMYVAVDGIFMAKFYIRYEPNDKFCRNAKRLTRRHMHLLIRTFDPNINDSLIAAHPILSTLPIKIVHKKPEQLHDYAEARMYSGLVTSGSTKDILKLLLLCDNIKSVHRIARIGKMFSALLGVLLPTVLALTGHLTLLLSPISIVYWLLWAFPLIYLTKRKL